jgi:uncharacterized protein HemX
VPDITDALQKIPQSPSAVFGAVAVVLAICWMLLKLLPLYLSYREKQDATVGVYVRQLLARVESLEEVNGRLLEENAALRRRCTAAEEKADAAEAKADALERHLASIQKQVDRVDPTKP